MAHRYNVRRVVIEIVDQVVMCLKKRMIRPLCLLGVRFFERDALVAVVGRSFRRS